MKLIAIGLSALCLTAPATATVNLVADGSFESNPAEAGGYSHYAGKTSFDAGHWYVTGTDILHVSSTYHVGANPPITFNAQDGRNSLDLTGTGNSGPDDGVYQDVATIAGQVYTLSFFVGRVTSTGSNGNDYLAPAAMHLSIDGATPLDFVNAASVESGIAWKNYGTTFTASAATTRIAFINGNGNDYLGLDNVSLTTVSPVPEPASWTMLMGGFSIGGVGARLPRKQAKSNAV